MPCKAFHGGLGESQPGQRQGAQRSKQDAGEPETPTVLSVSPPLSPTLCCLSQLPPRGPKSLSV